MNTTRFLFKYLRPRQPGYRLWRQLPRPPCFPMAAFSSKMKKGAKQWMQRHVNDHFVKMAKLQFYRSRASYKLLEIDIRYNLLKIGMKVIDVGAAPGGWSQVLSEKVNFTEDESNVVAVDLLKMDPVKGVKFIHGDVKKDDVIEKISEALDFQKADLVWSDAVPDFIGEKYVDHISAWDLNYMVLGMMKKTLKKGGRALIKVMRGPWIDEVIDAYLAKFESVIKVKPSASRSESSELYLLWTGYEQSQHSFTKKVHEAQKEVHSLKTEYDIKNYEENINKESRSLAEDFLADLRRTGREVTPGMKQALIDLGMTEAELKEPQLTKQSFIEKAKKKQKYEADVDIAFRKKFGIKQHSSIEEYTNELKTKAKELEGSIDKIDAEERKLLNSRKFEYETHLNEDNEEVSLYEDPTKEDFKGHFFESYSRVKSRIKEMKEEGIITNEIEEEKAEQEARRAEKIAQEQEAKETEKEHRFIQRIEKRESRYTEEKQSKRRQNYYQRKENREYKSQGFGVDNNNMWDPDD